jgi:hypothetical protein
MRNVLNITAAQILSIKEIEPERLFSNNIADLKLEYKTLAKKWHPDHNAGDEFAGKVFAHINVLHANAERWLEQGKWMEPDIKIEQEEPNVLVLRAIDDNEKPIKRIRYLKHVPFELGEVYIGNTVIAYVVESKYIELFENACNIISGIEYPNDRIKNDIEKYLPKIATTFLTADKLVMVVNKNPDLLRLRDVLDHFNGKLDPKHVCWIQNTLHNLVCFLQLSGLTHNSISPDDYYVDIKNHSGALLGGWWFSAKSRGPITVLTERSKHYAPPDIIRSKIVDSRLDLELIKATGREILGDITGMQLPADPTIPQPMVSWLLRPTCGDAVHDYKKWANTVLPASYGERRFVKLDLTASDIYKE